MRKIFLAHATLILGMLPSPAAQADGKLDVMQGWIRTPPPGAAMLAGYARLINRGDAPLTITGASSAYFAGVWLHETVQTDGVERMRPMDRIELAPGAEATLSPGGKHLMLMRPRDAVRAGQKIQIHFDANGNSGFDADFVVRDDAPEVH